MSHIGIKYSKQIKLDSDSIKSILNNKPSENGKKVMDDYLENNHFAEESDYDLTLFTKDSVIFGFDFLHNGQKLLLPDIMNSKKCKFLLAVTHSPFIFDNELEIYAIGINIYMDDLNEEY